MIRIPEKIKQYNITNTVIVLKLKRHIVSPTWSKLELYKVTCAKRKQHHQFRNVEVGPTTGFETQGPKVRSK